MTFLQPSISLRASVSGLIVFFLLVYLGSFILDDRADKNLHAGDAPIGMPTGEEYGHDVSNGGDGDNSSGGEDDGRCNWSDGQWVYDEVSRPLYSGLGCAFMNDEINCDKYGRENKTYQHWRWQPRRCDIPPFDATRMLEELRGKRMIFVGDSVGRNQWVSMVCMLEAAIPEGLKYRIFNGSFISFKALEYGASIDFYWSPMLLESNGDDPLIHRVSSRAIRLGKIESHAMNWVDADVLVFDTYVWWKKPLTVKIVNGTFWHGDLEVEEVDMTVGFKLALETWSDWLRQHVDRNRTRIFFMSLSPTHVWAKYWGGDISGSCYGETEPVYEEGYTGGGSDYGMMMTAEKVIAGLQRDGVVIQIVNITQLSEYRKDGHPSVFRRQFVPLSPQQLANPKSYADCTHWCLPGVPDVWNEMLYAYMVPPEQREPEPDPAPAAVDPASPPVTV